MKKFLILGSLLGFSLISNALPLHLVRQDSNHNQHSQDRQAKDRMQQNTDQNMRQRGQDDQQSMNDDQSSSDRKY